MCRTIPITECRIVGFTECEDDDGLELETFVAQDCQPGAVKILSETKKVPECNIVTKQQCDSKWATDAYGK